MRIFHNLIPIQSSKIIPSCGLAFAKATASKPMHYTYILRNFETGRYYIGSSPDLKNRFKKHKSDKVPSTKSNLNYELEWDCGFKTKTQAVAFEQYLKSGSGRAFMKKRFFNKAVVLAKDNAEG